MPAAQPPLPPRLELETDGRTWTIRQVGDQDAYDAAYGENAPSLAYWRGVDLRMVAKHMQDDYEYDGWHRRPPRPGLAWRIRYYVLWGLDDLVHLLLRPLPDTVDYFYLCHLDPFGGLEENRLIPRRLRTRLAAMTTHPWHQMRSGAAQHEDRHAAMFAGEAEDPDETGAWAGFDAEGSTP